MADENVTPIRRGTPKPPDITAATDEQQDRVWRLRALIQCVREAPRDQIDDPEAALSGLADYADAIHSALDAGILAQRAQEIAEEVSNG